MKMISALVTAALLSISITDFALAQQLSPESGILIQPPTEEEMEGGTTLSFPWRLLSLPTQDGCLVEVYNFTMRGLFGGSPENYKVAQLHIPFGEGTEVPGYDDEIISWFVTCSETGKAIFHRHLKDPLFDEMPERSF